MPGKTTRSSNLELLRILCMLLIIGDHLTGQSGIADYTTPAVVLRVLPDRLRVAHCVQRLLC